MVEHLHCLDGCKHPWLLVHCLPHPLQSLHRMHHCQEGSHCVPDLLGGWMGSMVPWTSSVDCNDHIRMGSNCFSSPVSIPFLRLHIGHSSPLPLPTSFLHSPLDGMLSAAQSITASPSSCLSSPCCSPWQLGSVSSWIECPLICWIG